VPVLEQLIAAYRKIATPLAEICLATSGAIALLAGIAALIDRFVSPWNVTVGLLWVAGFYLLLGVAALVRHAIRKPGTAADSFGDNEPWTDTIGNRVPKFFFKARTIRRLRRDRTREWIADRNRIPFSDSANERSSPPS